MSLLDRLEKRFGRYSVENATVILIAGQVLVYAAFYLQPNGAAIFERLQLDPTKVYAGEVWRLVTFMFLAPLSQVPIFVIFFWYLFYMMGTALEQTWGVFKFNVYCGLSYLLTVAAAFIAEALSPGAGVAVGDYLYGSVFLAFARLFPDFQLLLFFLLPVKVKWLAMIQWIFYGLAFFDAAGHGDWFTLLVIAAAVGNWFIFFGGELWTGVKQGNRRRQWRAKTKQATGRLSHECRVCGLTSDMAPKTAFRYCSKCNGQCCYCPDHIHDHEHVMTEESGVGGRGSGNDA